MKWSGGLAEWTDESTRTAFLSVAFTWRLDEAATRAIWYRALGYRVLAGGPALFLPQMRHELHDIAEVGAEHPDAIARHNPLATIASRGCPVGCWFCIVPAMEGREFTLLPHFEPRPILCDNNLSALPEDYQRFIIGKYKHTGVQLLDANSGFEPRTFGRDTFMRWREILRGPWRFAYDETGEGDDVARVMGILRELPPKKKRVYVLIGNEPFDECMARVRRVIDWGGEPHVQPLMKLNATERTPWVRFDWTEQKLRDVARWANGWVYKRAPFSEYDRSMNTTRGAAVQHEQSGLFAEVA